MGELLDSLGPDAEWRGTARDRLLRLFLRIGELVARDPELSKVMLIENMRNLWLPTEADPLEQEFDQLIRRVLIRGRDRGELMESVDIEIAAKLLEAAHFTTMVDSLKAGSPGTMYRDELAAKYDIIFRGLGMAGPAAKKEGS